VKTTPADGGRDKVNAINLLQRACRTTPISSLSGGRKIAPRPDHAVPITSNPGRTNLVCPSLNEVVEIPMVGRGASLNVAVAGSLVLYKLAGLS
jgi:hypothetical protein